MLVGHGDIATALLALDSEDRIYFASGVSNSREDRESEFARELELLKRQPRDKHVIYFSTLSQYYSETPYVKHKRHMEHMVKMLFRNWTIIRLGNITWGTNPNTIINSFRAKIKAGEKIEVRDEYRYLLSKEEFLHWTGLAMPGHEMNITGMRVKVAYIFKAIKNGEL